MKSKVKNLRNLMAGILLGLPFISFASGDINVVAMEEKNEMEKIKVEIPELFDLNVSIIDNEGRVLYNETLKKGSKTALVYNLSQLEDGTYTFLSSGGHQEITKMIEVKDNRINVIDKVVKNKPIFILNDNLLKINYLNKNIDDIKISLNDEISVYYDKTIEDKLVFNKTIDISNLRKGNYYVSLNVGDDQHNFYFDVF